MTGFEPATLRSQSGCATKLRHIPVGRAADHPAVTHGKSAGPPNQLAQCTTGRPRHRFRLIGPEVGSVAWRPVVLSQRERDPGENPRSGRRRGCSLMVKPLPSKQDTRVRFPSPAPQRAPPVPTDGSGLFSSMLFCRGPDAPADGVSRACLTGPAAAAFRHGVSRACLTGPAAAAPRHGVSPLPRCAPDAMVARGCVSGSGPPPGGWAGAPPGSAEPRSPTLDPPGQPPRRPGWQVGHQYRVRASIAC